METKYLKSYAPKARRQFIEAISNRAAQLGITEAGISEIQISGSSAIIEGRAYTKKQGEQRNRLARLVQEKGYALFIRETAYTWFNRLVAIRYMEMHDYLEHGYRVLSHPSKVGEKPEILEHASEVAEKLSLDKDSIVDLQLDGNKDEELYRLILVGQCNYLNSIMPFMFEAIDGPSELLLPDNLTKTDSILHDLITDVPEDDWKEIESIGWLYQFYISEYKDAVMGKVVKSEDIPAATQLFTPNWIVKYLVENSVGRQWLATYPNSPLKAKMDYYIEPAEQSDEVLAELKQVTPSEINPEDIKVLDPACGSGHILVEAYDVLKAIYTERLYRPRDIPSHILNKNIFGLDIDIRAAQLASFALLMKARADDSFIFDKIKSGRVIVNVHSIESSKHIDANNTWALLNLENKEKKGASLGLFYDSEKELPSTNESKAFYELLKYIIDLFMDAKNLGSLIQVDADKLFSLLALRGLLKEKMLGSDLIAKNASETLLPLINQSILLAQKYQAVIANPPYMGLQGMNAQLKAFSNKHFKNSKADLFSIFMERGFQLTCFGGLNAQINMQSWMFLSSFEDFRKQITEEKRIVTLAHLGPRAFSQISGEAVQTAAWIISNEKIREYKPVFFRLINGGEDDKKNALLDRKYKYEHTSQLNFSKIPGSPIAYWAQEELFGLFERSKLLEEVASPRAGLATGDNPRFQRYWFEISINNICFTCDSNETSEQRKEKWYPCHSGGYFRRWYGNHDVVVNWQNDGHEIRNFKHSDGRQKSRPQNTQFFFKEGITWTKLSTTNFAARYRPKGFVFDDTGRSAFCSDNFPGHELPLLATLNSSIATDTLAVLNPSMSFTSGDLAKVPYCPEIKHTLDKEAQMLIADYKKDWDYYERSWDFESSPFLEKKGVTDISEVYSNIILKDNEFIKNVRVKENNLLIKIDAAYGYNSVFNDKLLTLTRNPMHRLGAKASTEKTRCNYFVELISFFVGCSMGRYSVDRKGIVFANVGNVGFKEVFDTGAYQTIPVDDDGIIPLSVEDWLFDDDATVSLRNFVKIIWGEENVDKNLGFIADSLCLGSLNSRKDENSLSAVRRYFSAKFFKDHCKSYKNRPIYWLFSSGKEKAFECLVYVHRYNEGTLSRMRTEYVTPLMGKYENELTRLRGEENHASGPELRTIEKEIVSLQKKQIELRAFDEQLKHYADMRISLDLDKGVKVNYGKFGTLLADVKSIHGKG
jgi:type II restriction/modification system DNA methylase subunit YeeA